eukprot:SAG31_NODE_87_length_26728_cov_40.161591_23_plen_106_part_00
MKTVRELRRDRSEPVPHRDDSTYKPVVRQPKVFNSLKVPKSLQAQLPFRSKPKLEAAKSTKQLKAKGGGYLKKRALVMEPDERQRYAVLQQVNLDETAFCFRTTY